jgi:hypothetical protein
LKFVLTDVNFQKLSKHEHKELLRLLKKVETDESSEDEEVSENSEVL